MVWLWLWTTVFHVGEVLLQKRAVLLLTTAHEFFIDKRDQILAASGKHMTGSQTKITLLWVLNHLTMALQHHLKCTCKIYKEHLKCTCKVHKYGTLLYRPNTDFIPLLQESLSKLSQQDRNFQPSQLTWMHALPQEPTMEDVLDDLNVQVLDQCHTGTWKKIKPLLMSIAF